jgi:(p)ppGpp synthase/HD superfamily hydrolase
VRAIAEKTQGIINDEVSSNLPARSRRAADRFAGLPIARAALWFASARHAGQCRDIDHAPFIAHSIEVGQLLDRDYRPDEVIVAGLLHDVLEKTATTGAELQRRFGARIARLVESVSDDASIVDYESRKRELRNRVAHADADMLAIFAADKIAKVRELALIPARRVDETKARAELAHYRASLTMLRRFAGDLALVDLLDAELNRLVAVAVTGTRGDGATTSIARPKRSKPRAAQPEPAGLRPPCRSA